MKLSCQGQEIKIAISLEPNVGFTSNQAVNLSPLSKDLFQETINLDHEGTLDGGFPQGSPKISLAESIKGSPA